MDKQQEIDENLIRIEKWNNKIKDYENKIIHLQQLIKEHKKYNKKLEK